MFRKVKRADGRIVHQVYSRATGKKEYVGSYDSEKAAKNAFQEYEVTQRGIAAGTIAPQLDTKRTLAQAAEEWLASLQKRKSRSWDGYSDRMKLYILPALANPERRILPLGDRSLAQIRKADVGAMRDDLSTQFAPATVNGALICLSSAFTYFVEKQWVDKNPCHGVAPVEDPVGAFNWIKTREEITRLLAACADELRDMVAVAIGSGLRLDELLHLQWADVDLSRRLITVHRGRKGTVKSGKLRHVPILDTVLPILRERALKRGTNVGGFAGSGLLMFPGRVVDGRARVRTKQGVTKIYKLALKRAGLDTSLRWHDLRHTFASHWVMNGGDIFRLSKVLGHSSVKITQDRYAHLMPEAYEQDYQRVSFVVPTERANLHKLERNEAGQIVGRRAVLVAV